MRDIGGLVVIDFIDMMRLENKRAVEDEMRKALSNDRARVQVGRISRFGLLELSRQRMRSSLSERWTQDVNTLSTSVLRLVEEETSKQNTSEVRAIVSPDMSSLLLNERRIRLNDIEARSNTKVVVISDATRPDSRFEVLRIKDGKIVDPEKSKSSLSAAEQFEKKTKKTFKKEEAAVNIKPSVRPKKGIISKIVDIFSSKQPKKIKVKTPPKNFKRKNVKNTYPKKINRNQNNKKRNFENKQPKKDIKPKKKEGKETQKPKKLSRPIKDKKNLKEPRKEVKEKPINNSTKANQKESFQNEIKETKNVPEKERVKPKKLSRPKKDDSRKLEEKQESLENANHKTNERASNDPRNNAS